MSADFLNNSGKVADRVALQGDATPANLYSTSHTLGIANTVTSFTVPTGARGFRITKASADLRFAINTAPPNAPTTTSGTSVVFASLGSYNVVAANTTEVRLFEAGVPPSTLQINSTTAGTTFTLEFF